MNPRANARRPHSTAVLVVLTISLLSLPSCLAHEHTVGLGPNDLGSESARQFYSLGGLMRWNEVDTQRMTKELRSYRITTYYSWVDLLLAPILFPLLGTTSRTVVVER